MLNYRYIIDEHGDVVPEPDLIKWAMWFEHHHPCSVARTKLGNGILVSTIFLALDFNFDDQPLLFETAVFLAAGPGGLGPELDRRRYPDWPTAADDHLALVAEYEKRRPGD